VAYRPQAALLIAGTALGLALLTLAYGLYRGKMYTATGEIQIQPGSASELKQSIGAVFGSGSTLDVVIESDSRILQSDKLLDYGCANTEACEQSKFYGPQKSGLLFFGAHAVAAADGNLDDPYVRNAVLGTCAAI
jgi:hypothetical protein